MADSTHRKVKESDSDFFKKFLQEQMQKAEASRRIHVKLVLKGNPKVVVDIDRRTSFEERQKSFGRKYAPSKEALDTVERFVQLFDLKIERVYGPLGVVDISGTVEAMEKAFQVELFDHQYLDERRDYEKKVLGHNGKISVPEHMTDLIACVIGLANIPHQHQAPSGNRGRTVPSFSAATGYPGQWFADYYNFPESQLGKGQEIVIIAGGGGFEQEDFDHYFEDIGLDSTPKINTEVITGPGSQPGQNWMFDYELATDCQVAGAVAPEADITVCFTENDTFGFSSALLHLCEKGEQAPAIASYSWGASESHTAGAIIRGVDRILHYLTEVCQVSIFCATGDFGSINSFQPDKDSSLEVQYPASSPWVTACGGTMFLLGDDLEIEEEVVWNAHNLYDLQIPNAGGGGYSRVHARPEYQEGIEDSPPEGYTNNRGLPDVSAHADMSPANIGYWVRTDGQNWISGGTSAATPLWAALTARLNEGLGKRIGFLNPYLYRMADGNALRSITSGTNALDGGPDQWKARPGWDPCTGLGVPDGAEILRWLKKHLNDQ
ncbi:MAG: S53 family peptidase [Saprospiraceae bacterium]|nr:S53 family peptidase [Saprospiraceae bacterium]